MKKDAFDRAYDAHERKIFLAFKDALTPLMQEVAPDWLLHHIEMRRLQDYADDEFVEIKLVIRPIGSDTP